MVIACFRQHGLEGNPVIRLPPEHAAAIAALIGDELLPGLVDGRAAQNGRGRSDWELAVQRLIKRDGQPSP